MDSELTTHHAGSLEGCGMYAGAAANSTVAGQRLRVCTLAQLAWLCLSRNDPCAGTALYNTLELATRGLLQQLGKGPSTRYSLPDGSPDGAP